MKWIKIIPAVPKLHFGNLHFFKEEAKGRCEERSASLDRGDKVRFYQKLLAGMWDRDNRRC